VDVGQASRGKREETGITETEERGTRITGIAGARDVGRKGGKRAREALTPPYALVKLPFMTFHFRL
jgi:hypothetical protein